MALRKGFTRYAFSVQYHGSSFLGFPFLGKDQENTILPDGTDLRGYFSVEGRIRLALQEMLMTGGKGNNSNNNNIVGRSSSSSSFFDNFQVSSRTDRGVHALKNTCHVDIANTTSNESSWCPNVLRRGLNYYLSRQGSDDEALFRKKKKQKIKSGKNDRNEQRFFYRRSKRKLDNWSFHHPMNEVRILNMIRAPTQMKNKFYLDYPEQPEYVDWNIRYSAIQRTYVYRILACTNNDDDTGGDSWALPFEWDRSWRIFPLKNKNRSGDCTTTTTAATTTEYDVHNNQQKNYHHSSNCNGQVVLDINAMRQASTYLVGTHDFSSFRSAGCSRSSPIVTMEEIVVHSQFYGEPLGGGGLLGLGGESSSEALLLRSPQLVTIKIVGTSFVYRQVRNIVGALVAVGRGSIPPHHIQDVLEAKDRTIAPAMAPAHGLFLADVQHDDIAL